MVFVFHPGKMSFIADLESNVGHTGFDTLMVIRTVGPSCVELEQVAHCFDLDCHVLMYSPEPASEIQCLFI